MDAGHLGIITENEVAVPMRDGTVQRANVFRPDADGAFPGLLSRTPYGKASGGYERYVRAGYAVASMDSRGRYGSEGEFKLFTEVETGDAVDGYDSVEWLAAQPWCDGNIGTIGASYNGWMQWMLAREQPPHLKAMSAVSIPTELTGVDWQGSFRAARRVEWLLGNMAPDMRRREGLPPPHTVEQARHIWHELEHGRLLAMLPFSNIIDMLPPRLAAMVEGWMREPNRKAWRFNENRHLIEVPNIDFTGWYDHCSSVEHLADMQANAATPEAREQSRLIIGPWSHVSLGSRQVEEIDFGATAAVDQMDMLIRWFDYWLKGIDNGVTSEPAVRYFVIGTGKWRSAPAWPPPSTPTPLYLQADADAGDIETPGRLDDSVPAAGVSHYTYDPRDPVPTPWSRRLFPGPADRRKLDHRRDILRFLSAPLTTPLEIAGLPEATLYVATTARDTDFFVRLIDDDPDGIALELATGMVRLRHRHGYDDDDLVPPNTLTEVRIGLGHIAACFQPGHRIRVDVTSSDFPSYDRNHNTGGDDFFDAALVTAEQTLHHGGDHASRISLPVI
jgi:putative CocE/NonD family hydrolase